MNLRSPAILSVFTRRRLLTTFSFAAGAALLAQPPSNPAPGAAKDEDPPEEDESVAPEKFVLNPLESERNVKVGDFYFRKKKYSAAAQRYERATKFNPSSPEAFFKLGEAQTKLNHGDVARTCFEKVVQLDPKSKLASEARKKLGG